MVYLNPAVKPGICGLAFTMGKWFLTDNSATVGRILMISSADPHEILILIKWWKNHPSSKSAKACTQNLHYVHSGFWPILAYFCPKVLRFYRGQIFNFEAPREVAIFGPMPPQGFGAGGQYGHNVFPQVQHWKWIPKKNIFEGSKILTSFLTRIVPNG